MSSAKFSNWIGLWSLYLREVRRFLKVHNQTIVAPMVTTMLYLAIFALALGKGAPPVEGTPFLSFLAPGLIAMAVAQNAFANTSSSLMIAKVQGNIIDTLMPPLSAAQLTVGLTLGGITRGLMVGTAVLLAMLPFVDVPIAHPLALLYFAVAAAMMLSLIGTAAGIWSEKFDQIAGITNFIITPLTFLSGTFYSVERLPAPFLSLAHLNPFFYMIDGFRWSCIGRGDMDPWIGGIVLAATNAGLWALCHWMFATGYRLKP